MGGRGGSGRGSPGGSSEYRSKLPELTGSQKQIKWAEQIRQGAFDATDLATKNYDRNVDQGKKLGVKSPRQWAEETTGYGPDDIKATREVLVKYFEQPKARSASFIIDNRQMLSYAPMDMIKKRYKERNRGRNLANLPYVRNGGRK